MKYVIDPGHGGEDRDNLGYSGQYVEADGVLYISLALEDALMEYADVDVTLTRYNDKTLKLTPRGLMAEGADVFISEHTNACSDPSVRGVEVFYSVDHPEDEEIAEKLCKAISDYFNIPNRGAKVKPGKNDPTEDYFTVIDTAEDVGCPHVFLIEVMFHSNEEAEKTLMVKDNLKKMGHLQSDVFAEVFNLIKFNDPNTPSECHKGAWGWGKETKVTDGTNPKNMPTREQVIQMLYDYHNKFN